MIQLAYFVIVAVAFVGGLVLMGEAWRPQARHPACGQCGYNLIASVGVVGRCPECGADFKVVFIVQMGPSRLRTDLLFLGIAMVLLSSIGCCGGSALLKLLVGPGG